jgi:hypothetical protein
MRPATLATAFLIACGGDEPLTRYDTEIQPIWDDSCNSCHSSASMRGELDLESGPSTIVGVTADQVDFALVEPGDPDNSYLMQKLFDTHIAAGGEGDPMPQGGTLSTSELDTIEAWIADGAE